MKKLIQWLAKAFNANIIKEVEKTIYVDRTIEKTTEKQVALEGVIEGDVTVKGNLHVIGNVYVAGNISSQGDVFYGMSTEEVRMKAGKEITCYKIKGE